MKNNSLYLPGDTNSNYYSWVIATNQFLFYTNKEYTRKIKIPAFIFMKVSATAVAINGCK